MLKEEAEIESALDSPGWAGAASDRSTQPREFHDLDHLAGTWDEAQTEEFLRLTHEQRTIEIDLWTAAAGFENDVELLTADDHF